MLIAAAGVGVVTDSPGEISSRMESNPCSRSGNNDTSSIDKSFLETSAGNDSNASLPWTFKETPGPFCSRASFSFNATMVAGFAWIVIVWTAARK